MPITSVETALDQYNSNLDWNTDSSKAQSALEAIRYLIVNQPQSMSVAGRTIVKNLSQLEDEKKALEQSLGARSARANGRSRVLRGDHLEPGGIQ